MTPNREPQRARNGKTIQLLVFLAVLATGVVLIALGVPVDSLATVSVALSGLYGAFNATTGPPNRDPDRNDDSGRA